MLLMVEKGVRGGICHYIYLYAKADNKCMKDYDQNKGLSYLQYWDVNYLNGWAMSQYLAVNNFEWIKHTPQFNEDFIKSYNRKSDKGHFLKVDAQYTGKLHELHNDLPFLPDRMKIMKIEKVKKLVANLHGKTKYITHIPYLKQSLNLGLF